MSGTLVVGAGQAGVQLAVSLREAGDAGPITVVGAEPDAPYQRPPLSKAFLLGRTDATGLAFRTPGYYADHGIELATGERVSDIGDSCAITASGRCLEFEQLALTLGARVRRLDVPGGDLAGVHYIRELASARRLRAELDDAERVVVIGGGFIGLETAAVARGLGRDVTVVEAADRLIGRAVATTVSDFYRQAHERRGTRVRLGSTVVALTGDGGTVRAVHLADGTELPADLVVVGIGVTPRTELAERLGLECDGGIVVDAAARTSRPEIVAAGDCTVRPHVLTGEGRVRLESVQNAVSQAKAAAATLTGTPPPRPEVPWFWSDQADLKLQIAGLSAGHDETAVRGNLDAERFSVLYYRRGTLIAVDAVNAPADYLTVRKALGVGLNLPAERVREGGPLKEILATAKGTRPC
ncbi:NAD(P)/FAD-dependent oxidoreductase [Streptomyces justiciae]|uniref:NAD(P)/FAD-dependent oxidoreductase n=1 Tax=Streptomyces justiciae TaxID=2780140 RepID=UPI00211794E3|nr:FAD-dependent oxidoreductase [Streptomyces justiciae]MCW8379712.1 FAD-dependent oxidoreductase [Streptomyces justiciae]